MSSRRRVRKNNLIPSPGSLVTSAVVAYGVYRLIDLAWNYWKSDSRKCDGEASMKLHHSEDLEEFPYQHLQSSRVRGRMKRQRIFRCQEETVNALHDFLPTLRRCIEQLSDASDETKELKELRTAMADQKRREKERKLWTAIKVKSFAQIIVAAYAHTILFLVLTVQVHLLGGKLLDEQLHTSDAVSSIGVDSLASDRMASYQESHKIVLSRTYEYFFDQGLRLLMESVTVAVDVILENWDVTHQSSIHTTHEMINQAITDICDKLEERGGRYSRRYSRRSSLPILRFLHPTDHGFGSVTDDFANSILDETFDIIESPVFQDAQRDCLANTLKLMREESWSKIFKDPSSRSEVTKPLATVITKLKKTTRSFFVKKSLNNEESSSLFHGSRPQTNLYFPMLERIPTVLELGEVSFN